MLLGALFLGPFLVVFWHSSRQAVLWDLSYILDHAYRISLGDVPYRDFVIPHPPLTFLIQAAIIRLFDSAYLHHVAYAAIIAGLTAVVSNRIIRYQIARRCRDDAEIRALLLSAPLVFLNGYCILSQPFYDPDCAFWLLVALYALLRARQSAKPGWQHLVAGMLLVVPLFFKQNIGLAGVIAVHACLLLSAATNANERANYGLYLAGSLLALLGALGLIHAWVGVRTYYYWTITYAMRKRPFSVRRVLFIYENWRTWVAVACAVCGLIATTWRGSSPAMRRIGLLLIALPFSYASFKVFARPLSWEAAYFWAIALAGGSLAAVADWFHGERRFESTMPLLAAAVVHASFMSQGVGGSSYGVWPMLPIALATPAAMLAPAAVPERRQVNGLFALVGLLLLTTGYLHVSREERLAFVETRGTMERAGMSRLARLATPGPYISEFERLVQRCAELVPSQAGIVLVPGEDPFFFATRRKPRFPVLMFDDTITPYGPAELMRLLAEKPIEWVVLKTRLQLHESPWTPLSSFDLSPDYEVVDALPGYLILKRRLQASGYHAWPMRRRTVSEAGAR